MDNVTQIAQELRDVFMGKQISMETIVETIGSTGEVSETVENIVDRSGAIAIMFKNDFMLLLPANEPTVEWLDDKRVQIVDGNITTILWI